MKIKNLMHFCLHILNKLSRWIFPLTQFLLCGSDKNLMFQIKRKNLLPENTPFFTEVYNHCMQCCHVLQHSHQGDSYILDTFTVHSYPGQPKACPFLSWSASAGNCRWAETIVIYLQWRCKWSIVIKRIHTHQETRHVLDIFTIHSYPIPKHVVLG